MKTSRHFQVALIGITAVAITIGGVALFVKTRPPTFNSLDTVQRRLCQIALASKAYKDDLGRWPQSLDELSNDPNPNADYLKWFSPPRVDPSAIAYTGLDEGKGFGIVQHLGADGQVGGEGANRDTVVEFSDQIVKLNGKAFHRFGE